MTGRDGIKFIFLVDNVTFFDILTDRADKGLLARIVNYL